MTDTLQIIIFYLGTECFGLDIKGVNWVVTGKAEQGTKMEAKADRRTVTLNNEVIPVLNLYKKLHIKPLKENSNFFDSS